MFSCKLAYEMTSVSGQDEYDECSTRGHCCKGSIRSAGTKAMQLSHSHIVFYLHLPEQRYPEKLQIYMPLNYLIDHISIISSRSPLYLLRHISVKHILG